ncbi:hypothetical protein ONZ45_g1860 [Pleurotus djamor]|nr:hypothetical protein ONZ45_g1860 [Pleurotus djamor]
MGKAQKKTGKGRLDKYYKLAKEQGYRARSAFKLIQLNKKYSFLESARCCIDLCAAPGGWLQVASKYMPVNSVIVGVDLVPIKPIPRVVTFAADITTPQCRSLIRSELKDWKADVVLHDGAPNVGTAWIQDAYSQAELVLMSLKLAVEFLVRGGVFITKVFRSVDYNNLIWVFNQLFGKVEATKPPSSRNVSAEIFVVCRDFLAPKHIDPKFLDPKHVFKDLASSNPSAVDKGISANNVQANVFQPEKQRRKRDGYADGDYTLFHKTSASEFIRSTDPIAILGAVNKITFDSEEEKQWIQLPITTTDVKANCDDLKVLGKGDFKTLLKWRLALREEIGLDNKSRETEDATEVVEIEVDEEEQMQEELQRLNEEAAARAKRSRRRANELKTKTIQRMQLQMTAPLDIGMEQNDPSLVGHDDMFDLEDQDMSGVEDSDDPQQDDDSDQGDEEESIDGLEAQLNGMYDDYRERLKEKDAKIRVKEAREKNALREEWRGVGGEHSGDDDMSDSEEEGGWGKVQAAKARIDDLTSDESDGESSTEGQARKRKRDITRERPAKHRRIEPPSDSKTSRLWFSQDIFGDIAEELDVEDDAQDDIGEDSEDSSPMSSDAEDDTEPDDDDDDDFEVVPPDMDEADWDVNDEDEDQTKQAKIKGNELYSFVPSRSELSFAEFGLVTPEAVTLAQQLVNRQKTRTELVNDGFNRYSLNSKEGLPSWFLDDETKHYKVNLPISKEAVAALRAKQRALDARPIKKVAEAKARKKMKAQQRLEKALKKAEGVNATSDISERDKAQQIEKLMRKGLSSGGKPKKEVKVVVAKGVHKGIKGRPKGVKGRYAMVDARMRKEVRAKKRKEKATKKRSR